ncbi:MAG: DUF4185 domain-containing protein [Clostridia bacterium]|nr:DUF4185 domain-containing protein [Clostridia bacterium]
MDKTVFVLQNGAGSMDGSSPENAATLAQALGMVKYGGGTLVICGPLDFDKGYVFPSNYAIIRITSLYNGTDHRECGAALNLSACLTFYGSYILENVKLNVKKSDLFIFFRYSNVTLGNGIICELQNEAENHIGIYCGCDAKSASYRDTLWESCKCDAASAIYSGTWRFVRVGNRRADTGAYPGSPLRSVFGTVSEGVSYSLSVNGGHFTGEADGYSSATGMNSVDGDVFMEINGGRFDSPIALVCEGGENPDNLERHINGKVTLQINGGEFASKEILAYTDDNAKHCTSSGAMLTVSVCGERFDSFTVKGARKECGKLNLPPVRDNKIKYTAPPHPLSTPLRTPFTEEDEKCLGKDGAERMKVIRSLRAMDGSEYYGEWRTLRDDEGRYNLRAVESVKFVEMLSGEYSPNRTQTNYGVASVGGGYMVDCKDFIMFAFGDTKREDGVGLPWRSNMLAHSTDLDYTDGIVFDGFYSVDSGEYSGNGGEFLHSHHKDNIEMSKIPTGGVMVNGNVYFGFMSVRCWSDPEKPRVWKCNYGGLAKSSDLGRSWELPDDLRWPEESGFAQLHPVLDGDWVYIFAVPGGRRGGCKLMRVKKNEIESFAAYEYLIGRDENGRGIFKKGRDAMLCDFYAVEPMVGGVGVMYNEYLGEWVMLYCSGSSGSVKVPGIVMRVAKTLDGEWSDAVMVASHKRFGIVYEPRICARYVKDGGKHMMLICSKWEIYNSLIFDIELSRKEEDQV